jgi:hypothetical protein
MVDYPCPDDLGLDDWCHVDPTEPDSDFFEDETDDEDDEE